MAHFMFIRGNRNKRLFHDIGAELERKGHQVHLIQLELNELLMKTTIPTVFLPNHVAKEEYPISDMELMDLQIYNITFTKRVLQKEIPLSELRMYKRYMAALDYLLDKYNIEVICLFNGYHWIDQICRYLAKKKGLRTYFFEDGLFRPYTITCDPNGINACSSVPRDFSFYQDMEVDRPRLMKFMFRPEEESLKQLKRENLVKVASAKLLSMAGSLLCIHPNYFAHINFWQGLKYFVHKKWYSRRKEDEVDLRGEYIFLPFQVSRDTQIFYHSPHIQSMEQLLEITLKAVEQYNQTYHRQIKVIVKEHPEDLSRQNYQSLKNKYTNVQFVQKYRMDKLLKASLAVVTVNSTVGIEALAHYKKVITLGDALYNIDPLVERCPHPDLLYQSLQKSLSTPLSIDKIEKFLYYLRFHYQTEGVLNRPNKQTAKNLANRLEDYERGVLDESDWNHSRKVRID
ncbi:hypothetical protein ACFOST_13710 [Cytobacillus kochii]|uniref:capsular polysaccharide export protein, LipB/KpsS family n=1 Tax=Cytobacillus kochii TaxID=859143 RepID=UPI00278A4DD1|nr:hypothetical protein [Cytobacillus kochii]MDQ0185733.1 capsule polysaccharide modification protein KpsS [Cytobacillus kochii]